MKEAIEALVSRLGYGKKQAESAIEELSEEEKQQIAAGDFSVLSRPEHKRTAETK